MEILDRILAEQLATTTVNALVMHSEASGRLAAAESLDADLCVSRLEEISAEFANMAFVLGAFAQTAREFELEGASEFDRQSLVNLDAQMGLSLNTAATAAALLASAGEAAGGRAPSQMLMSQADLEMLLSDSLWHWLAANATKDSRRGFQALRASMNLPELG